MVAELIEVERAGEREKREKLSGWDYFYMA